MIVADLYEKLINYTDDKKVNTTMVVELGSLELPYKISTISTYRKYPLHEYGDGNFSYTFDHNNNLVGFKFNYNCPGQA